MTIEELKAWHEQQKAQAQKFKENNLISAKAFVRNKAKAAEALGRANAFATLEELHSQAAVLLEPLEPAKRDFIGQNLNG